MRSLSHCATREVLDTVFRIGEFMADHNVGPGDFSSLLVLTIALLHVHVCTYVDISIVFSLSKDV